MESTNAAEKADAQEGRTENFQVSGSEERVASPAARQLAKENLIDLNSLSGSGKNGRITKEDVVAASARHKKEPSTLSLGKACSVLFYVWLMQQQHLLLLFFHFFLNQRGY